MSNQSLKIAFVTPPIEGHMMRGVGKYAQNLFEAINRFNLAKVSWVKINDDVEEFDIVHYPYFDLFFLTLPYFKQKPTIVTVHDLIPLKYSQHFDIGLRGFIKWQIQKYSVGNCAAVITDSQSSKKDINSYTSIKADKIQVIYLAAAGEYKKITDNKLLLKIINKYKLPPKFLLYVGDVNYNKNVTGLIKAFDILSQKHQDLFLGLVGRGFIEKSPNMMEIEKLIKDFKLNSKIIFLGNVNQMDLVGIYNLALIYIQPSIDEGFGLPVLEAMQCGIPVVCSNIGSLKEIAGKAAYFVNPYDIQDIYNGIETMIEDSNKRKVLIDKGFQQASEFSWEKTARQTIEVYRKIYTL